MSLVPKCHFDQYKASHIPTGSFGAQSFGDELTVLDDSQMVKRSDAGDGPKAPRPFWDSAREAKWRNGYGHMLATAVVEYSEICPSNAGEVKGAILKANKTRHYDDIAETVLAINSMVTDSCAGWTLEHQRRAEAFSQGLMSDWYALPMNMNGVQRTLKYAAKNLRDDTSVVDPTPDESSASRVEVPILSRALSWLKD